MDYHLTYFYLAETLWISNNGTSGHLGSHFGILVYHRRSRFITWHRRYSCTRAASQVWCRCFYFALKVNYISHKFVNWKFCVLTERFRPNLSKVPSLLIYFLHIISAGIIPRQERFSFTLCVWQMPVCNVDIFMLYIHLSTWHSSKMFLDHSHLMCPHSWVLSSYCIESVIFTWMFYFCELGFKIRNVYCVGWRLCTLLNHPKNPVLLGQIWKLLYRTFAKLSKDVNTGNI